MTPDLRRQAKTINFGIIYGISAFGLAERLGIGREEARRLHQAVFRALPRHPRLYRRHQAASAATRATSRPCSAGSATTRRSARTTRSERAGVERQAINAPIQGTAADIIRRAMIRMEDALKAERLSARMLLQVHDELVFEAPDDEVEATLPVIVADHDRRALPGRDLEGAARRRGAGGAELGRGALTLP